MKLATIAITTTLLLLAGCESDSAKKEETLADRQRAALRDPFSAGPKIDDFEKGKNRDKVDETDISGGSIENFDKDAFKRDWDKIINP
jgi:hypothetical protein